MGAVGLPACGLALGLVLVAACTFGVDVDALSRCADRPCDDVPSTTSDAGAGGGEPSDGAPRDGAPPQDGAAPPCPTKAGAMVRVAAGTTSVCVDETEVTNDAYATFLAAAERPADAALALACRGPRPLVPTQAWPAPPGRGADPVVAVDFCQAQAFCVWAGKRLCGSLLGGALDPALLGRPLYDAWTFACGEGSKSYPYGPTYVQAACNGVDIAIGKPVPVGSLASCRAGAGAPADLSGNVWEWIDACERDEGDGDRCYAHGGAFNAPAAELTCASQRGAARASADLTVGFRCCAR